MIALDTTKGRRRATYAAFFVVVAAAWAPSLRGGFVWDDDNNLVASDRLHAWPALVEVFRQPAMWSADLPVGPVATYRPLALASFVVDHQLWGLAPWGFHLTSVILHALALVPAPLFLEAAGRCFLRRGERERGAAMLRACGAPGCARALAEEKVP